MTAAEQIKHVKFEIHDDVEFAIQQGKDIGIVSGIILNPSSIIYRVI